MPNGRVFSPQGDAKWQKTHNYLESKRKEHEVLSCARLILEFYTSRFINGTLSSRSILVLVTLLRRISCCVHARVETSSYSGRSNESSLETQSANERRGRCCVCERAAAQGPLSCAHRGCARACGRGRVARGSELSALPAPPLVIPPLPPTDTGERRRRSNGAHGEQTRGVQRSLGR